METQIDNNKHRSAGFTLLEISVAMMIIGMLLVPTLRLYHLYLVDKKIIETERSVAIVQAALGKYVARYGRYPAPAHPNVPINNDDSGQEIAAASVTDVCSATSTGVCTTNVGTIDTNFDVDIVPDFILIGSVPYASLGIPYQTTIDGYGYQLKYAVTTSLTSTADFNNNRGVIDVLNDQRDPTRTSVYQGGVPRGQYVVLSHGPDNKGAFNLAGTRTVPCGAAVNGLDFENCNNDAVFRNNIFQFEDVPDTTPGVAPTMAIQVNTPDGPVHFDDYVFQTNSIASGIWSFVPNQSSISSTQNGNVEIGLNAACTNASCLPVAKVNVNGVALAEQQLKTTRFCNVNQADCNDNFTGNIPFGWFTPATIGGTPTAFAEGSTDPVWDAARQGHRGAGILCVGGRGLSGINNFDEECQNSVRISNPAIVGAGCDPTATGLFPVGIDTAGQIICE